MTALDALFASDVVAAIERLVDERIVAALAQWTAPAPVPEWLTVQAAARELDCTADAVRMRAKRGRLVTQRQGRRVYVLAASVRGEYDPVRQHAPAALATPRGRQGR